MEHIRKAIEDHGDAVWQTAFRLLSNEEDALDCYQQTFLEALQIDPKTVRSWRAMLSRIVTARSIDRLRQRYRDRRQVSNNNCEAFVFDSPGQRLLNAELIAEVQSALTELPNQQAEAFCLRHLEQLTHKEIAEQLEIDPGHVRVLIHRATLGIRELIEPDDTTAKTTKTKPKGD